MQTIRIFHTDIKKYLIYLLATLFLALCSCKKESVVNPADDGTRTPDKIIVYTNYGTVFSYIDCNTFEITKTITMDIPETFKNRVRCMCTSANKEYLVFTASTGSPSFMQNIITYSIKGDSIYNIFPTGLDSVSAPRLISANIPEKPGLIYFFSCTKGLYQIDFLSKEVKKLNETSDYIDKEFYQSPDGKWIIVNNSYSGTFSDLEFYNRSTGLNLPEFTLNKNNCDSIYIDDIAFSENNKVFTSIRLPNMKWIENYFGSYDLQTGKLYKSSIKLPFSINPYYITYSSTRKEVYMVGKDAVIYVIDVSTSNYTIKSTIGIPGKIEGPSGIKIRPDEKILFVSCPDSNLIFVIDLDQRKVIKQLALSFPYKMEFF